MMLGDIVIIPTDNMYVFAAQLYDDVAIEKIYKLTGKSVFEPLTLMATSVEQLSNIIECASNITSILAHVWPGPLTGIFKTTEIHERLSGDTIIKAFIPKNAIAQNISKKYGVLCVAGILAEDQKPILNQEELYQKYNHQLISVYTNNDQEITYVQPTLVDFTENKIEILQNGPITLDMLEKIRKSLLK